MKKKKKRTELDLVAIGSRLHRIRNSMRLTMDQVGEVTGTSKSMVSDVENGKKKPSAAFLNALSVEYNIDLNFVFTGEGNMFRGNQGVIILDEEIKEMLQLMTRSKMVKFNLLNHFWTYKTQNNELIMESSLQKGSEGESEGN